MIEPSNPDKTRKEKAGAYGNSLYNHFHVNIPWRHIARGIDITRARIHELRNDGKMSIDTWRRYGCLQQHLRALYEQATGLERLMEIVVRKVDEDEAVRNLAKEETAKEGSDTDALTKEDSPGPNTTKRKRAEEQLVEERPAIRNLVAEDMADADRGIKHGVNEYENQAKGSEAIKTIIASSKESVTRITRERAHSRYRRTCTASKQWQQNSRIKLIGVRLHIDMGLFSLYVVYLRHVRY